MDVCILWKMFFYIVNIRIIIEKKGKIYNINGKFKKKKLDIFYGLYFVIIIFVL